MTRIKDFGGRKRQKWSHKKTKTKKKAPMNKDTQAWILFGKNAPLGSNVICMKPHILVSDMYCLDLRDLRCDQDLVGDRGMFHLELDSSICISDTEYHTMNWQGTIPVHGPAPKNFYRDRYNYLILPAAGIEVRSRGPDSIYEGCPYIEWQTIQLLAVLNNRVPGHSGKARFLYFERDAFDNEDPAVAYFTATELFA